MISIWQVYEIELTTVASAAAAAAALLNISMRITVIFDSRMLYAQQRHLPQNLLCRFSHGNTFDLLCFMYCHR